MISVECRGDKQKGCSTKVFVAPMLCHGLLSAWRMMLPETVQP
jgi:hypothetical protein